MSAVLDNGRPLASEGAETVADTGMPLPSTSRRTMEFGFGAMVFSLISALATYLVLTGLTPIVPRSDVVVIVLFVNGVLIVAMLAIIAGQMASLWHAWRERVPGARLHVRIVALFSLIATVPAILLAIAATTTFSRSLDTWFSTRTRQIIESTMEVASAYLEEHGQVIRTEIVSMSRDLDSAADLAATQPGQFENLLLVQAGLRNLPAAFVIDASGRANVSAIMDDKIAFRAPPPSVLERAGAGQVVLMHSPETSRIAAVKKLEKIPGAYLYVIRGLSPQVVAFVGRASAGMAEYQALRRSRGGLQVAHGLMYFMIALTTLLAAIWIGLWFASRFVAPIRRLIQAAQQVSRGNLEVELPIRRGEGDLRRLSLTFNTMTAEIKAQRDALVTANTQLVERRRFMEAVLSGVSAGVLGLDSGGVIQIANRSAEKLLGCAPGGLVGQTLATVVPAFAPLPEALESEGSKHRQPGPIVHLVNGEERTFAVRVTRETEDGGDNGFVMTFDDITELMSAQRTSAWADIARRIAHEIKNPLTPIQLSAERLRRKYGKVIQEDREVFDKCTETIIRQVGDVARMVDEFSSFARMPKPQIEPADLRHAVRDSVTLFESGFDTDVRLTLPPSPVVMAIDRRLISQAMTNLVKNGVEAIQSNREAGDLPEGYRGLVEVVVRTTPDQAIIEVIDNGTGLGTQNRARLLEPYVTTKTKGTGLGLAIVQKIVEQHRGRLELEEAPVTEHRKRGALVRVTLPIRAGEAAVPPASSAAAE